MKILLVEDNRDDRVLTERELSRLGHAVVVASNGAEALDAYARESPDLVITDIFMAGMDGFELTRAVQRLAAPRWLPVLFLSAHRDDDLQAKALQTGADGYLVKPLSGPAFEPRLAVIERLLTVQRQAEERAGQLERYYAAELEEKRVAEHLVAHLVNAEKLHDPAVRHWLSPAASFSGDVVAAARTPGNVLHVLLADAAGRGLAASINVLPVIAPFYRMTEKGFGIDAVVREMNAKVRQLLPAGRFVAATVAAVDFREGYMRVWNGGNPALLMLGESGEVEHEFVSRHLPLGVAEDGDFEALAETRALTASAQLVLYSDGVIEAENEAEEVFGLDRLKKALAGSAPGQRFDAAVAAISAHVGGRPTRDDVSIMLLDCGREIEEATRPSPSERPGGGPSAPGNWRFSLRLGAAEIRQADVVPALLELASQFDGTRECSGELFVVLSELFNNALDHGLLLLDSSRKAAPDGMEGYLEERQARLAALGSGSIEIDIEQFEHGGEGWLRIVCRDTGPGFDHAAYAKDRADATLLPFGRGLTLVRSIATSFEFNEAGNAVTAIVSLARCCQAGRSKAD